MGKHKWSESRSDRNSHNKKADKKPNKEQESPDLLRRSLVIGIPSLLAGAFALKALKALGLEDKPATATATATVSAAQPQNHQENQESLSEQKILFESPDKFPLNNISIPTAEFVEPSEANVNQSTDHVLDKETILKIKNAITQLAKEYGEQIKQIPDQESRKTRRKKFFADILNILSASKQGVGESITKAYEKAFAEKDVMAYRSFINNYLMQAGLFFYIHQDTNTLEQIYNIFEIDKTEFVKVSDNIGSEQIKISHLKNSITELPCTKTSGENYGDHAIIFDEGNEVSAKNAAELLLNAGASPSEADELHRETLKDTSFHEAIHNFLARRFKKAGKDTSSTLYEAKIFINVKDFNQSVDGNFTTNMFNELTANGFHAYKSSSHMPYKLLRLIGAKSEGEGIDYELAYRLATLLALKECPDTQERSKLIEQVLSEGKVNSKKLKEIYASNPSAEEASKKIGELMYKIGYYYMDLLNRGEMPRAK